MDLSINGGKAVPISSGQDLEDALTKWGRSDGDFVILEDGDADYIQSAVDPDGYIVEVRDGANATMYRAVRPMPQPDQRRDRWSREEALSLLKSYLPLRGRSAQAAWEDMHMRTTVRGADLPSWFYWLAAVVIGLGAFAYRNIYR